MSVEELRRLKSLEEENRRLKSLVTDLSLDKQILDQWAYANKVTLDFSRPGKPTDNAFIESFNGRIRAECLNENWFLSIDDARQKVEAWRQDYNNHRPHSALGNLAPEKSLKPARQ